MAETVQGKPGAVVSNDIRLAAAALLVASDGDVLGQATVLSLDLAVTTAEVAQYASAKVANASSLGSGPLAIALPQFQGPTPATPLPAAIEAIDSESGFAVVRFSGMLPVTLPGGLLGAGGTPDVGSGCDIFYSDPSWSAFYQIGGKLETPAAGIRLRVRLAASPDEPVATALAAAPVFVGTRFLGIVLTASSGLAEVVSVDAMALSRVTPAVRGLLPWIDPTVEEGSSAGPTPSVPFSPTETPQGPPPLKPEDGLNGAPAHPPATDVASPTPKVDSDLWSRKDRLGYEAYARTIAELITHRETVAPLTIGIKAPWGAGKTSVMKRVQHLLDGDANLSEKNVSSMLQAGQAPQVTLRELLGKLDDRGKPEGILLKASEDGKGYNLPPRITVWFNAWKYQTSEQIWAGMAHCIISQVTARMKAKDRELFWLRLHARRVNANEVRKKIYTAVAAHVVPWALIAMAVTALLIAVGGFALSYWGNLKWAQSPAWQLVTLASGLVTGLVKRQKELGEKAADTVKELVREPDYEGKMGYLHLVESDIREVLDLVTTAEEESSDSTEKAPLKPKDGLNGAPAPAPGESVSPPSRTEREKGGATSGAKKQVPPVGRNDKTEDGVRRAPLVVFVDDLDRCAPNKVAEVVEAINLFLCGDYPNCVFVLGMEPGMVAAALEVANKDVIEKALEMGVVDNTAPVGWRFMEKIVQLPITIPPPTKHGRESYVEYLTGVREFHAEMARMLSMDAPPNAPLSMPLQVATMVGQGMAEEVKARQLAEAPLNQQEVRKFEDHLAARSLVEVEEKTKKALEVAAPAERRAVAEASKRVYAKAFSERDPAIREFVDMLGELVDGNPRQIKRYVNVFRFYSTLRHSLQVDGTVAEKELPSPKMLAKFVAMSIQWPHAVDCLRLKKDGGVSRLEFLEGKAREIGDKATADAEWKELVGEKGMGLGRWAETRAFREFLRSGESLGRSTGHGLW